MARAERAEEADKEADWLSWITVNSLYEDNDARRSDGGAKTENDPAGDSVAVQ
jgi:hypothetical protein